MNIQMKGNEQITKLLNDWYQVMLHKQVLKATNLKQEIDEQINMLKTEENTELQDQNLLLYYSLLDFRYKLLTTNTYLSLDEFDVIEKLNKKSVDNYLSYYYHFYKAIHNMMLANYIDAGEHFGKAEKLLIYVPDEIEHAEFNYKLGVLYYHIHKPLLTIKHVLKAKELYEKQDNYKLNQLECDVTLGLASITLNQFEQAEEYFVKSLESAKKQNHENLVMLIRYNLGFLYAKQNISETAIRYLTDVYNNEKPYHKTLFLLAQEHYKLKQLEKANAFLEKGMQLADTEYIHHFRIVQALYDVEYRQNLESAIVAGINYFETQQLYGFIEEYAGHLAKHFYNESNYEQASKYFNIAYEAKQTLTQRSALK